MKILSPFKSVFNDKQLNGILDILRKQVAVKNIQWKDIFTQKLKRKIMQLLDSVVLIKIPIFSKIDWKIITENIENIYISLFALTAEANEISQLIGRHEILFKDNVHTYKNIAFKHIDLLSSSSNEQKSQNVLVEKGRVEIKPFRTIEYYPREVSVEFSPENYFTITGNDITSGNIEPTNNEGFWINNVYYTKKEEVISTLSFDFPGVILLNEMQFSVSTDKPLWITESGVLYYDKDDNAIPIEYDLYGHEKELTLKFREEIATEKIDISFQQRHSDFIWSEAIDNADSIMIEPDNEKEKALNRLLYYDIMDIYHVQNIKNVYRYGFGLYSAKFLLKNYELNIDNIFYSQIFRPESNIQTITLKVDENIINDESITYELIEDDKKLYEIEKDVSYTIENKYYVTESINSFIDNSIVLSNIPIYDTLDVSIDNTVISKVKTFSEFDNIECIVDKNFIYFKGIDLSGKTVNVQYAYISPTFQVKATLNNDTIFHTPIITDMELKFNE